VQDRDGARLVLVQRTRRLFPFIERIFANAGYPGWRVAAAVANAGSWTLAIVKRNELHRFVVLPKRWTVERTLAWISRNRRLARDFERYAGTVAAVKRNELHRFVALPKRWIIERTLAWISRNRRLARDFVIAHKAEISAVLMINEPG
jgi:transposase